MVSMGPLKERMRLGPRMYGDSSCRSPSVLPQCDLLITHGGNNTICEGLPFRSADDRAAAVLGPVRQRPAPRGDGLRRAPADLRVDRGGARRTVERLLADEALRRAHEGRSRRDAAEPGNVKGADLIERLAVTGAPVR